MRGRDREEEREKERERLIFFLKEWTHLIVGAGRPGICGAAGRLEVRVGVEVAFVRLSSTGWRLGWALHVTVFKGIPSTWGASVFALRTFD